MSYEGEAHERQRRIPSLTIEMAPVYRCGASGRRYLSPRGAYLKAAGTSVEVAYPCMYEDDGPPYNYDIYDKWERHRNKLVTRLARWLRWRDGREAASR